MDDITEKLQQRLQALVKQADEDRAGVRLLPGGDAVYSGLIDALRGTLHNLPPVDEKPTD